MQQTLVMTVANTYQYQVQDKPNVEMIWLNYKF